MPRENRSCRCRRRRQSPCRPTTHRRSSNRRCIRPRCSLRCRRRLRGTDCRYCRRCCPSRRNRYRRCRRALLPRCPGSRVAMLVQTPAAVDLVQRCEIASAARADAARAERRRAVSPSGTTRPGRWSRNVACVGAMEASRQPCGRRGGSSDLQARATRIWKTSDSTQFGPRRPQQNRTHCAERTYLGCGESAIGLASLVPASPSQATILPVGPAAPIGMVLTPARKDAASHDDLEFVITDWMFRREISEWRDSQPVAAANVIPARAMSGGMS